MDVYRRAFGEAWFDCLWIVIGLNRNKLQQSVISAKVREFQKHLEVHTGKPFPKERIMFFDARDSDHQDEMDRFSTSLRTAPVLLTGAGNTIYHSLREVFTGTDTAERTKQKKRMSIGTAQLSR